MNAVIDVYNKFHLGDHIINFIFFYKIKDYIEKNNITIHYYCLKQYHKNLLNFKCSENIQVFEYNEQENKNYGYELWQCRANDHHYIEDQLCVMFNDFLKYYNIPIIVDSFEYQDDDLFRRFEMLDNKYKNIDILIINSRPYSQQYHYDKTKWDNFIIKLGNNRVVATSAKVEDESILALDDICVKDIAAIALNVKIIIAINTGPSVPLYNTDILNNVDVVYLFNDLNHHNFKTRKFHKMQNIEELSFLLK